MLYRAFGLVIDSELDLSGDLPVATMEAEPDVRIRMGEVPDTLEETSGDGTFYQLNPQEFRFAVDDIGAYYVRHGTEVTVQPAEGADPSDIRLFLLGSTLGAVLHQRGMLPLHASAIQTEAGAVLFCGHSGVGKSTMAAALTKRGYKLLTDDISVIMLNSEQVPVVMPGSSRQKLWWTSLKQLEVALEDLERLRPKIEKYAVPVQEAYSSEPAPIARLYILNTANNLDNFKFEPVEGMRKLRAIGMQAYRRHFLLQMGTEEKHYALLTQISKHISVTTATRPDDLERLEEFVDQMEEDMRK